MADYIALAAKLERTIRHMQQSVLLLMVFGLAVWCMLKADMMHMAVLMLFTMCACMLMRWGLPKS